MNYTQAVPFSIAGVAARLYTELGLARGHSDKFERARHAIQTKQYGALTEVCLELMRLLPENARKEAGSPEVRSHIK